MYFNNNRTTETVRHTMEKDGLYYLELFGQNRTKENLVPLSFLFEIPYTTEDKIWLHHYCSRHPLLDILKIMFPLLFKAIAIE